MCLCVIDDLILVFLFLFGAKSKMDTVNKPIKIASVTQLHENMQDLVEKCLHQVAADIVLNLRQSKQRIK